MQVLEKVIREFKEKRQLPYDQNIEDLYNELKKAKNAILRNEKVPKLSIVELEKQAEAKEEKSEKKIEHVEGEIQDNKEVQDVEKEEKEDEYEITTTEMPEATWTIEDEAKENKQNEQEKEEKEYADELDMSDYYGTQEENDYKKSIRKGLVFGPDTTIDRRIIEKMQQKQNNEKLRKMSPEEFMSYIGYVEIKRREQEPVKYEDFIAETAKEEDINKRTIYAKRALKFLEKMETNKSEDEIWEMDAADRFIYGLAEQYDEIVEQEEKQNQEQRGMEIG